MMPPATVARPESPLNSSAPPRLKPLCSSTAKSPSSCGISCVATAMAATAHKAAGTIVMIGDTVHNVIDGILIGAAFLTDIHLGAVTAIAVATHEIPQELGDFAVLLHSGFSRGGALLFNGLSGLATVAGGIIANYGLQNLDNLLPYALALAASSIIYVAVADLVPGLHKRMELAATAQQVGLISAGVLTIYLVHGTLHQ